MHESNDTHALEAVMPPDANISQAQTVNSMLAQAPSGHEASPQINAYSITYRSRNPKKTK